MECGERPRRRGMRRLWYTARSPLLRHPVLLLRKVRRRAGLTERTRFVRPAAGVACHYPAGLGSGLAAWRDRCDTDAATYPVGRVFGTDFTEDELLRLCCPGSGSGKGLRGDVKLPWEFSRGHAHALNALRAGPGSADAVATSIAGHLQRWLAHNADVNGTNWICAMEVAIRAVNWICADAALEGRVRGAMGARDWDRWLYAHGAVVWQRLEARLTDNNNHYLADLLALLWVGSVFPADRRARRWERFAGREMERALCTQTYGDGTLYESSLRYHVLVLEIALLFCLVRGPALVRGRTLTRIRQMCRVTANTLCADGDVFAVGDDDGGRVIPLDFVSRSLGRARVVLALAEHVLGERFAAETSALYPRGGWWVSRRGAVTALVSFGGVCPALRGGHRHNDAMAVVAEARGVPVLADPGSYIYTPDRRARNWFRSTRAHNTVAVDGYEQSQLPWDDDGVFRLPGPRRAATVVSHSESHIELEAAPGLYGGRLPRFRRRVTLEAGGLAIQDQWFVESACTLQWSFVFAAGLTVGPVDNALRVAGMGFRGVLGWSDRAVAARVTTAFFSPFYGQRRRTRRLCAALHVAAGEGMLSWRLETDDE